MGRETTFTHKKVKENPYTNIDEKVKVWLDGKHGRIGLIYPDEPLTQERWEAVSRKIATIFYK